MLPNIPTNGSVIYSIFVRQYGENGTFADVTEDLDRIEELGVTHLWLMPIHPIGELEKKGSLGCPYAIKDYKAVNPEYGTLDDFTDLLKAAHEREIRVLIDCVYNHTSPDSVLATEHPEFFRKDSMNQLVTRFPEWSDVVDLKYYDEKNQKKSKMWEYLIGCLLYWVELGVDGFRCDVASVVPLEFWVEARTTVSQKFPDRKTLWIAESSGPGFMHRSRQRGIRMTSEPALYKAFDVCYQYSIFDIYQNCIKEHEDVALLFDFLLLEESLNEPSSAKLRFVDNHDQPRLDGLARTSHGADAWLSMTAFLEGPLLLYQGIESFEKKQHSLFEKEPVDWQDYGRSGLIQDLCALKSNLVVMKGSTSFISGVPIACIVRSVGADYLVGVFDIFGLGGGEQEVPVPDGEYENLLGGGVIIVEDGIVGVEEWKYSAAIFAYRGPCEIEEMHGKF